MDDLYKGDNDLRLESITTRSVPTSMFPAVLIDLLSPEPWTPSVQLGEYTVNDEGKVSRNADASHG
jgi:hypothetical protein